MSRHFARGSLLWRLAPLAWMGLLFLLSSQSDISAPFDIPDWLPADKFVHAGLYAVLAALLYLAGLSSILAVVVAGLYGVTDEFHQMFVPGREPDLLDLLADLVGAVIGVWLIRFLVRIPAGESGRRGESVE